MLQQNAATVGDVIGLWVLVNVFRDSLVRPVNDWHVQTIAMDLGFAKLCNNWHLIMGLIVMGMGKESFTLTGTHSWEQCVYVIWGPLAMTAR